MLSGNVSREAIGLHHFTTAFLIYFIFGLISFIIAGLTVGIVMFSPPEPPELGFAILLPSFIINVIGTILYIYYLWNGFSYLEDIVPDISLGKIASILILFSIFIYPLIVPFFRFSPPPDIHGLLFLAGGLGILGVIGLIGIILLIVELYRIGEYYDSTTIKVGAILLIFLGIIGAIILYVGFKDVEKKPKGKAVILPPPPSW